MRQLWMDKNARKGIILDLCCAIPLAAFGGPWWSRLITVALGMLFLAVTFSTGYFAGQTFVYRKTIVEMEEMRETVSNIAATHQRIAELPPLPPEFTPPRHYH